MNNKIDYAALEADLAAFDDVRATYQTCPPDRLLIKADVLRALIATALTPSPTPYVRPAAEIQKRLDTFKKSRDHDAELPSDTEYNEGYIAGITFALTPPTQEPR